MAIAMALAIAALAKALALAMARAMARASARAADRRSGGRMGGRLYSNALSGHAWRLCTGDNPQEREGAQKTIHHDFLIYKSDLNMILNLVASFPPSFSPIRATATHFRPNYVSVYAKNKQIMCQSCEK